MTNPILRFAHISDTHLHENPQFQGKRAWTSRGTTAAVIESINSYPSPLDFVLHTGDVGNDPLRKEHYLKLRGILAGFKPPLYVLPGNHDHRVWLREIFYPHRPNSYYTFEQNGVQLVCLDTTVAYQHHGLIEAEQLTWLDEICRSSTPQPLVVALHHHPFPLGAAAIDSIRLVNGEALHQILVKARHRLRLVLFGHIHERVMMVRDGITYASTLSTWYQSRTWHGQGEFFKADVHQPGYTVVTLTEDGGVTMQAIGVQFPFNR